MRRIVQISEEGHPCCQYCHSAVAYSLQLHNSPLYSKVNVHAALGVGGPRWQPLNVAFAMRYWRDASRAFWQVATVTAADSYDHDSSAFSFLALVLQPRGQFAAKQFRSSTVMDSKFCNFRIHFFVMLDFNRSFHIFCLF